MIAWLYSRTFRVRMLHRPPDRNYLYAIWHEQQMQAILTNPDKRMTTVASRSKDGDIIAGALEVFRIPTARGSSSRGGAVALHQLAGWAQAGRSCAVTVDGPRGPRHQVKRGIAQLAKLSGCPIVPVSVVAASAWRTRSWDRFAVAKPFSRVVQCYGAPVQVGPEDDVAAVAAQVEATLHALNAEAIASLASP
jgi:lysophospholipid acyltransferase (LPLAT)-like uncharacterized protein